jgi:hypothetical protein
MLSEPLLCAKQKPYYTKRDYQHGNERPKHDEDQNKNIDERKPPYQITNDNPEHLQRLCNETRITKTLIHRAAVLLGQMNIHGTKVEKTSD